MACDLMKTRIFVVDQWEDHEDIVTSEWNGRDSDELCGETTVRYTKRIDRIECQELEVRPLLQSLDEKVKEAEMIIREHPDLGLSYDQRAISTEASLPSRPFVMREARTIVAVHCGMQGQYVWGVYEWGTFHYDRPVRQLDGCRPELSLDDMTGAQYDKYKGAMLYVEEQLRKEGILDTRYELDPDAQRTGLVGLKDLDQSITAFLTTGSKRKWKYK